jgi:hypothetical protein
LPSLWLDVVRELSLHSPAAAIRRLMAALALPTADVDRRRRFLKFRFLTLPSHQRRRPRQDEATRAGVHLKFAARFPGHLVPDGRHQPDPVPDIGTEASEDLKVRVVIGHLVCSSHGSGRSHARAK